VRASALGNRPRGLAFTKQAWYPWAVFLFVPPKGFRDLGLVGGLLRGGIASRLNCGNLAT